MLGYLIFIFLCIVLLLLASITRKLGYKSLNIYRKLSKTSILEGEKFDVTITVENNKWIPVSFLCILEEIPGKLRIKGYNELKGDDNKAYHTTKYNILWYERIKRTYSIVGEKRGTYLLRSMKLTLGDIFGFSGEVKEIEDYVEILVMPKIINLSSINLDNRSLMGDIIQKRWLYKDPLYIRGIREYNVEDRMKDIHWKSSLKMNKLMVKEYDYTSDNEVTIIANVQTSNQAWESLNPEIAEEIIRVSASMASVCLKEHIPTGMWTNAYIKSYNKEWKSEVQSSLSSYKSIMELSARMDTSARLSLEEYLAENYNLFGNNCTYILITAFLNDACVNLLHRLKRKGINIILIDASNKGHLPDINGMMKISYKGEKVI